MAVLETFSLPDCLYALFQNNTQVNTLCAYDSTLYTRFNTFNSTDCIADIYRYASDLEYTCVFYYIQLYNVTTEQDSCIEFKLIGPNTFQSFRCLTLGEHLTELLDVKDLSQLNSVFAFTLSILFFLYYVRKLLSD